MALSYKESKRRKNSSSKSGTNAVAALSNIQALDTNGDGWEKSDRYEWYDEYSDEHKSYVDDRKNVSLDDYQINLVQETHSQFIPFQMDRYYDGVDLVEKDIWIHYVTPIDTEDAVKAVNVQYSDDTIEFAWLVTDTATVSDGELKFEILISGENSKGEPYLWKSRTCTVNILKPLSGSGDVEQTSNIYDMLFRLNNRLVANEESIEELFSLLGTDSTGLSDMEKNIETNRENIEELALELSAITSISDDYINNAFNRIYG